MIYRIDSDLQSFKTLDFHDGLNVIVAERAQDSSQRQTRNAAGKTSILKIIHLCAGSQPKADSIFRQYLHDYRFSMEMDVGLERVTVSVCGEPHSNTLVDTPGTNWPVELSQDEGTEKWKISRTDWRHVLNWAWFGHAFDRIKEGAVPSMRSLFPYFVRLKDREGFSDPFKQNHWQSKGQVQVAVSYLLGLDWELAQEWEHIREKEKELQQLRQLGQTETMTEILPSSGKLRTKLTITKEEAQQLQKQLESFKIHERYHELEEEASRITREIGQLNNDNVLDREYLAELEEAMAEEEPPELEDLTRLYERAGIVLPEHVQARFETVRDFHETVVRNRVEYLRTEAQRTKQEIRERCGKIEEFSSRRAQVMAVLQSHGALDHFSRLRSRLSELEGTLEVLRQQLDVAESLEEGQVRSKRERARLYDRLRRSFQEQTEVLEEAIRTFGRASNALYEDAGQLVVEPTENGPEFDINVEAKRSAGIGLMQVFCFDMLMMHMCQRQGIGPGFLVHDSHIFDGVDERQVARALELGADWAKNLGFQYIVTVNSDALPPPKEFRPSFSIDEYMVPVTLTDATETGGLFGFRFG